MSLIKNQLVVDPKVKFTLVDRKVVGDFDPEGAMHLTVSIPMTVYLSMLIAMSDTAYSDDQVAQLMGQLLIDALR